MFQPKLIKIFSLSLFVLIAVWSVFLFLKQEERLKQKDYGVFIGIHSEQAAKLANYQLVVIEPAEFSLAEIDALHQKGITVYGYLNLGAIETYRPYYEKFKDIILADYQHWQEEYWIDARNKDWQQFIINQLAEEYLALGLDGFFVDNLDLYYHYPQEEMYKALQQILAALKIKKTKIIINGGDVFVSRCLTEGIAKNLFDAVNQETVFTRIDVEQKQYGVQSVEVSSYFQHYLERVKAAGLDVYLLEYAASPDLAKNIAKYCQENGFFWYNAQGLELD